MVNDAQSEMTCPEVKSESEHFIGIVQGLKPIIRRKTVKEVKLEDFELKQQIGEGAFGKVLLAVLKATGREYAIKVIRKDVLIEND